MQSIAILVKANPRVLHLPFITDGIIYFLQEYMKVLKNSEKRTMYAEKKDSRRLTTSEKI
jgi:hypothetical protein